MKIRKIKFKNIHSLKGEHEVDFSNGALSEAGLFLITGPTGSGKSTLLDIITLALYNRIPRIDSAISTAILEGDGGIMTRNAKDCYAEVEYSINGNIYRSHWSVERNRNNNLNPRKQELTEVISGNILDSGMTTVPKKNEEIIGLSYDQFVKAMVLSQGQFSKLLLAPRDERNKLLEDITGAKAYSEIGKAVFARYRKSKSAKEEQELKLGEIILIPEEEKRNLQRELTELDKTSPAIKKKYDVCKEQIDIRKNLIKQTEQYNLNLKEKEEFEIQLTAFNDKKLALTKHNKLVQYRDILNKNDQNNNALADIKNKENENNENLKNAISAKQNIENEIVKLIGKSHPEEKLLPELELFRKKVGALREKENLFNSNANLHKNLLESSLYELNLIIKETPVLTLNKIQTKQNEIKDIIGASGEKDLSALEKKISKLRENIETADQLTNAFKIYSENKIIISSKKDEYKKGLELVKKHQSEILKLNNENKELEAEVELLFHQDEQKKKLQSLDEHRNKLKKGEACPLCGSLEHPYTVSLPDFQEQTKNLLVTKRNLLEAKKELMASEKGKSEKQIETNEKFEAEILDWQKKSALNLIQVDLFFDKLKWKKIEDIVEIEKNLTDLRTTLNISIQSESAFKAEKSITQCLKFVNDWEKAITEFNKAKSEKENLYKGADIDYDVSAINNQFTLVLGDIKNLNKTGVQLSDEILNLSKQAKEFKRDLEAILIKEKISSIETLKELILEEKIVESIRIELQKNEEKRASLEATLKLNLKSLSEFKEKDDEKVSIETLNELFATSDIEWRTMENNKGAINQKLTSDRQSRERHKEGLLALELLKKDEVLWKTMNNLIGDATGKKFSNFVQDLTLEQLIGYANIRLQELSDRYILDIPTAQEADKNDSLKIFDTYMGDARRSVNTLSGGETFMVSLAMAFALSDLAARNVNIESIFIDEGFGTLDSDTLNQAISILEKMQNEGDKSIGIISHVAALKERITTQIKLEKSGAGYSSISIE